MTKRVRKQYRGQELAPGAAPRNVDLTLVPIQPEFTVILKTETETVSSDATLSDDASLLFRVNAGERAVAKLKVFFDTGATPDFQFRINGPSTPTEVVIRGHYVAVGNTNDTDFVHTAFGTTVAVTGTGGTTGGYIEAIINLINGSNDGNVIFQWAQNTSNASNTSVLSGSHIEYMIF